MGSRSKPHDEASVFPKSIIRDSPHITCRFSRSCCRPLLTKTMVKEGSLRQTPPTCCGVTLQRRRKALIERTTTLFNIRLSKIVSHKYWNDSFMIIEILHEMYTSYFKINAILFPICFRKQSGKLSEKYICARNSSLHSQTYSRTIVEIHFTINIILSFLVQFSITSSEIPEKLPFNFNFRLENTYKSVGAWPGVTRSI